MKRAYRSQRRFDDEYYIGQVLGRADDTMPRAPGDLRFTLQPIFKFILHEFLSLLPTRLGSASLLADAADLKACWAGRRRAIAEPNTPGEMPACFSDEAPRHHSIAGREIFIATPSNARRLRA